MMEINLLGDGTDLQHVKKMHSQNLSQQEVEVFAEMTAVLFNPNLSQTKQEEKLKNSFSKLEAELLSEDEIKEAVAGANQLRQIAPRAFKEGSVIYDYFAGRASIEEAEEAKNALQETDMGELTLTIPDEGESVASFFV